MVFSRPVKYVSILVVIVAILSKYELEVERNTWLLTKAATIHYDRAHVYRVIANVNKYSQVNSSNIDRLLNFASCSQWYPNVVRVEHVQLVQSAVHNREGEKYRLYTKFPLIGE